MLGAPQDGQGLGRHRHRAAGHQRPHLQAGGHLVVDHTGLRACDEHVRRGGEHRPRRAGLESQLPHARRTVRGPRQRERGHVQAARRGDGPLRGGDRGHGGASGHELRGEQGTGRVESLDGDGASPQATERGVGRHRDTDRGELVVAGPVGVGPGIGRPDGGQVVGGHASAGLDEEPSGADQIGRLGGEGRHRRRTHVGLRVDPRRRATDAAFERGEAVGERAGERGGPVDQDLGRGAHDAGPRRIVQVEHDEGVGRGELCGSARRAFWHPMPGLRP